MVAHVRTQSTSTRVSVLLIAASLVATATGCVSSGTSGPPTATTTNRDVETDSDLRDTAFTYQPDVVFVGNAGEAVIGATGDGLVWTIDGDARGAADLAVGRVMYASNQAVGRVTTIAPAGDDLAVTLAPVQIAEVFQDAEFDIDTELDADDVSYQVVPDLPGAVTELPDDGRPVQVGGSGGPSPGGPLTGTAVGVDDASGGIDTTVAVDTTSVNAAPEGLLRPRSEVPLAAHPASNLPPATKVSGKVTAGGYELEPSFSSTKIGLRIGYKALESKGGDGAGGESSVGLKLFVDVDLSYVELRVKSQVSIAGGLVQQGQTMLIEGLNALSIGIAAGAETAESARVGNVRIEVPIEMTVPIGDSPFVVKWRWAFAVKFVPGGKNSTLEAFGEWALAGPIGLLDGTVVGPVLTTTKSIIDSVTGLAPGVAAIIFAAEMKTQIGLGIPAAFVGPFSKLILDLGVANGSSFGAPFVRCVSATLDLWVAGGVGYSIKAKAWEALERLLGNKAKLDQTFIERVENVVHREQTVPDVGICVLDK